MTFLEVLQSHKGGLLRIKSELYWYGGRGFDGYPGRVCLILDGAASKGQPLHRACAANRFVCSSIFFVFWFHLASFLVALRVLTTSSQCGLCAIAD